MERIEGPAFEAIRPYFLEAALVAQEALCHRARCGSVIISGDEMIGRGFNAPAGGREDQRLCDIELDTTKRPKYDKTCCVHAEWNAILDACKTNPNRLAGSVLYFMRVNEAGECTDAGEPFCTVCSRLTLEAGISYFALYNNEGADIYPADEYNQRSYTSYLVS